MSTAKAPVAPSGRICEKVTKNNSSLNYCLKPQTKVKTISEFNYHQLTKTETSRQRQLDLTIESMQQ